MDDPESYDNFANMKEPDSYQEERNCTTCLQRMQTKQLSLWKDDYHVLGSHMHDSFHHRLPMSQKIVKQRT